MNVPFLFAAVRGGDGGGAAGSPVNLGPGAAWCRARALNLVAVVFVLAISSRGFGQNIEWEVQFGTAGFDVSLSSAADETGIYVPGYTSSVFPGEVSAGNVDVFLRKYDPLGNLLWTDQFGSPLREETTDAETDATGVYVSGNTRGELPGESASGGLDVFVRKYDRDGNPLWTTQFGTPQNDGAIVGGLVAHASGLYFTGGTRGAFPGESNSGDIDVFLTKLDPSSGAVQWTRQFGTPESDLTGTRFGGVSADDTGVYVVANLALFSAEHDPVLRKYDSDGQLSWSRRVGRGDCRPILTGVAAHGSGVYVTGQDGPGAYETEADCVASPGENDVVGVLIKHDTYGAPLWTRIIASLPEEARGNGENFTGAKGISAFDTGVYVGGNLTGSFAGHIDTANGSLGQCGGNQGPFFAKLDAYVRRFDFSGNVVWTRQLGSPNFDIVIEVGTDGIDIYAGGETDCLLTEEQTYFGSADAFALRISTEPTRASGEVHLVIGELETLAAAERLEPGAFLALARALTAALAALEEEQNDAARQSLSAFVAQIDALESSGRLSSGDASSLRSAAIAIAEEL